MRLDKITTIVNDIFLIRLSKVESKECISTEEFHFFDGKPLNLQAWQPDME